MVYVPNKKSETVRSAILSVFAPFSQAVKSITLDNGTEFADHKTIANRLNATVYFPIAPHLGTQIFPKIFVLVSKWPTAINLLKAAPCSTFRKKLRLLTSPIAVKN